MRTDPSVQAFQQNSQEEAYRNGFAVVAAAGATQGNATQIADTNRIVIVTVTASTQGVKLPAAATGKRVKIAAASAKGVKVYPFTADRIYGAATNAALALPLNKTYEYLAIDATNWRVMKGG